MIFHRIFLSDLSTYVCYTCHVCFFFFQAEDGIRDVAVTGVQTCALPIWRSGYSMRAIASAARRRSISPSGGGRRSPNSPSGSAARGVMDPRRRERRALQLLRELERASRRPRRGGLRLGRRREAQEERPAELVVVALVRLDHVAVQRRGLRVAGRLAEPDELTVLDDRDRLARELAGRHALHGGRELVEVLEERAPAPGQRVERPRGPPARP